MHNVNYLVKDSLFIKHCLSAREKLLVYWCTLYLIIFSPASRELVVHVLTVFDKPQELLIAVLNAYYSESCHFGCLGYVRTTNSKILFWKFAKVALWHWLGSHKIQESKITSFTAIQLLLLILIYKYLLFVSRRFPKCSNTHTICAATS